MNLLGEEKVGEMADPASLLFHASHFLISVPMNGPAQRCSRRESCSCFVYDAPKVSVRTRASSGNMGESKLGMSDPAKFSRQQGIRTAWPSPSGTFFPPPYLLPLTSIILALRSSILVGSPHSPIDSSVIFFFFSPFSLHPLTHPSFFFLFSFFSMSLLTRASISPLRPLIVRHSINGALAAQQKRHAGNRGIVYKGPGEECVRDGERY